MIRDRRDTLMVGLAIATVCCLCEAGASAGRAVVVMGPVVQVLTGVVAVLAAAAAGYAIIRWCRRMPQWLHRFFCWWR